MSRKRSPEYDFICIRCGCPCDEPGSRHLGGGQGMRACKRPPHVMLRRDFEAMIAVDVASLKQDRSGD